MQSRSLSGALEVWALLQRTMNHPVLGLFGRAEHGHVRPGDRAEVCHWSFQSHLQATLQAELRRHTLFEDRRKGVVMGTHAETPLPASAETDTGTRPHRRVFCAEAS
jgi:hypothetical protein